MTKQEIIQALRRYKEIKGDKYNIVRIGLFGSVARDASNEKSDIDVVVILKRPDMFNLVGIKQDLDEIFQKRVDLIRYREKMNPFLKKRIEKEAIYV